MFVFFSRSVVAQSFATCCNNLRHRLRQDHQKEQKEEKAERRVAVREYKRRPTIIKKEEEKEGDETPNAAEAQPSQFDNVDDVPTNFAEPWSLSASCGGSCPEDLAGPRDRCKINPTIFWWLGESMGL